MTNTTSISVPSEDIALLRARRENISEICRAAIKKAIAEGVKKSENNVTGVHAVQAENSGSPHMSQTQGASSND